MSATILNPYIDCTNKDESWESIFLRLIDVSSSGTLYLRTTDTVYSAMSTADASFVNADLTTVNIGGVDHVVYTFTHNFGTNAYDYVVKDNNGNMQIVSQSVIDLNSTYLLIDDTITGTWTVHAWAV